MRSTFRLLLLTSCLSLVGCVQDETRAPDDAQELATVAANVTGAALTNYAVTNALPTAKPYKVAMSSGSFPAASILCPLHDGTNAAVFFAWPREKQGTDGPAVAAAASRSAGRENVALQTNGQLVALTGDVVGVPVGCDLPAFDEGTPVLRVRMNLPTLPVFPETSRIERRAEDCPEGFKGTMIKARRVTFTASGLAQFGAWETDDMAGCEPVMTAAAETTADQLEPWKVEGTTVVDDELRKHALRDCKRVTVKSQKADGKRGEYSVSTCEGVKLPERLAWVEPPSNPGPPPPPPVPPCPQPSTITLPGFSTVADYKAAIAPYEALLPLPPGCKLSITSTAVWPFYQTFGVHDTRDPAYLASWAKNIRPPLKSVTRLYSVLLDLSWSATGGQTRFTERHELPRQGWHSTTPQRYAASIEQFPPVFETDRGALSFLYVLIDDVGPGLAATYRINGVLHPRFTGPHTQATAGGNGVYPYLYLNKEGAPLGNTQAQAAAASPLPAEMAGNLDERGQAYLAY